MPSPSLSVQAFLAQAGGNYSAGQGPMTGAVSFCTSPSSEAVILDLQAMPVRLWAVELATLYQSAGDAAKEKLRWCGPAPPPCRLSMGCSADGCKVHRSAADGAVGSTQLLLPAGQWRGCLSAALPKAHGACARSPAVLQSLGGFAGQVMGSWCQYLFPASQHTAVWST